MIMLTFVFGCEMDRQRNYAFDFYENGGIEVENFGIERNEWSGELPASSKSGYVFGGWYLDPELTTLATIESLQTNNQHEVSLYAKWIPSDTNALVEHWVEDLDGGYVLFRTDSVGGLYGSAVQAVPMQEAGFEEDINHPNRVSSGIPQPDVVLRLKLYYHRLTFRLYYVPGNGLATFYQEYKYLEPIQLSTEILLHDSYTFHGWFFDQLGQTPMISTHMPAQDLSIYAKWMPKSVTVTFETNEGTPIAPITGLVNTWMVVPHTSRSGYHLFGWYLDPEFQVRYLNMTSFPAVDTKLYALWIGNDSVVTVNHWYEAADGSYSKTRTEYEIGQIGRLTTGTVYETDLHEYFNRHPDQVIAGWPRVNQPLTLNIYYQLRRFNLIFEANYDQAILSIPVKSGMDRIA